MAKKAHKRIFLDYASTTPLDSGVLKAMLPYLQRDFGNPSAIYTEGLIAKQAVMESRKKIATVLNVKPEEVIFTASGTEADNLAIRGVFDAWKKEFNLAGQAPHIITTTIEHPGILEVCNYIEKEGGEVTYVPVEENGIVDPHKIKAALKHNTILVSIIYASNEIGTIQPLREISRIIQEVKNGKAYPYFHTDASQAGNYLDLSFQKLGVDLMTIDASKLYGPKGVGALIAKKYVTLKPIIFGGGQEKGLRSGTEHVANIVGCAEALVKAHKLKEKESKRLKVLQDYFIQNVIKIIPGVSINGDTDRRLPNNVNFCVPGLDAEFAVIKFDKEGIACSSASSCLNLSEESYSYVVSALGKRGKDCRGSSLRFTMGRGTSKQDINLTLTAIKSILIT
jgi:cysteine desulfurase